MKEKILITSFIATILLFTTSFIILKDNEFSYEERRKLTKLPEPSINSILNTNYMDELDKYFLDQFPFRNELRSIKANFNFNIYKQLNNNKVSTNNGYIFKSEYPTNKESINNFTNKINLIINSIPNQNINLGIIPDKNYYNEDKLFLQLDYDYIYNTLEKEIDANIIDFRDSLKLTDYYKTDTHWQQKNLEKVVKKLNKEMNLFNSFQYQENTVNDFYGVYYSQLALNGKSEAITYLTNDIINNSTVKYLNEETTDIYTLDKNTFDLYEIFLNGATPYLEITNNLATNDKELIIFRDSFASSLAPLLLESYKKITLIDTRYIGSKYYQELVEFTDQDILFLYSTLIINNSFTFKN